MRRPARVARNAKKCKMTEEQAEAAQTIAEAMRIFNDAVREAVAAGLRVDINLIEMHSTRCPGEPIKLISPSVEVRQDA